MAFFKEKRTGSLASQTVVDWGKTLMQGMNSDALNKHYQRKFAQRIKDLELTPEVFDTTLSFLEPKILDRVTTLQNEYKENASIAYNRPDFSDVAVNARNRNKAIIKEISKMQSGIQSLQTDEDAFADDPDSFFPHEINSNLSAKENLTREAYTELINGDYKSGNGNVVKDVYFTDGGKVMVEVEGLGPVALNDLRPFDQPREGLYSDFTTQLANIATTAATNTAEASALLTTILGNVDNNLDYSDIQDLLDFKVTIPSEFSGTMSGTIRLKNDAAFRELFKSLVENADDYLKDTNNDGVIDEKDEGDWYSFFNPAVREEKGMKLKGNIEQPGVVQGIEAFVRGFVERVGNQFIQAGKKIQDKKKQDELDFEKEKAEARFEQTKLGKEQAALKEYYQAVTNTVLANFGTNKSVFNEDGTIADVAKYKEVWMEELVTQVGDSNKIIATMGYDRALNYFLSSDDIQETLKTKLDQSKKLIESQLGKGVSKGMGILFEKSFFERGLINADAEFLIKNGLMIKKENKTDRGSMPYYQITDLFLKALTEGNLMKPQLQQQYEDLLKKKFYEKTFKEDFAGLVDFMQEVMFNRYTDGSQYENKSNMFTIQKDGSIKGYGGDPTTEAGKILLGESLLSADLLDIKDVTVASGLGDMNP